VVDAGQKVVTEVHLGLFYHGGTPGNCNPYGKTYEGGSKFEMFEI
jgi:hypothetical protein